MHRLPLSLPAALIAALVALPAAGCTTATSPKSANTTVPATAATTTTVAALATNLSIMGVGPIPQQPPFYPAVTVKAVTCGLVSTGRFIRINVPAGQAGTPSRSALAQPTIVLVVPGKAVLVDRTNHTLYEQASSSINPGKRGGLVLSLTETTSTGGDGRTVQTGAVDISGDYACPATDVAYPGT